MKIIPAIDLIDGRPVRLKQGDFKRVQFYPASLLELSGEIWQAGICNLHLVNLSAAENAQTSDFSEISGLLQRYPLKIDYGGGIRTKKQVVDLLSLGVDAVNIGTMIFEEEDLFVELLQEYPQRIIASLDVKDEIIAIKAWQESTEINLFDYLPKLIAKGLKKVCITDISKDGMLAGPATGLYQKIRRLAPNLEIIASGGVSTKEDINALFKVPCDGAIIGKAWLDKSIKLAELC